ncbi:uncharacterized protein MAM_03119 [Metarhizium album ARSEF 1941]|uniref:GPI anchored protein n=1 Tax=Metarhizium album (strain ARSEF 1941) TaxID=1081103 RepID=A0A0B2WTL5_METAS|nr:uncharacterized protein MAM_03119 [Metarhizium album ARSEF 1941]KHN99421.1 hypothetical protein MAM_03119 [Metarhizium album ARSEF 1941]
MAPASTLLLLPASLFASVSQALADNLPFPTAIKKQSPGSSEKILREHLAFAPLFRVGPVVGSSVDSPPYGRHQDINGTSPFSPPFVKHLDKTEDDILRRAAEALALLERRSSCPSGMNSCAPQGSPNKCCQQGTYCTDVPDTDVGHVACCPNGSACGGGVAKCPSGATSCAAALGGGCCIPGYVCQGVGCRSSPSIVRPLDQELHAHLQFAGVPSASATPATGVQTSQPQETVTSTRTTVIAGNPTTVIVTVTQTASPEVTTETSTQVVTPPSTSTAVGTNTNTGSATGNPPWRPTGSSEITSASESKTVATQPGCPTGFYGCLATHGGGCCQTDRDCHTYSCPPPSSSTVVSNGATIVVPAIPATGLLPKSSGSPKCAGGWFLCEPDAGPAAGCCPSGYSCGAASCFTAASTETGRVQKQAPEQSSAAKNYSACVLIATALLLLSSMW